MNRFKFTQSGIENAKKFLKGKKTQSVPQWAKRYKDELSIKKGKIVFDNKVIVPIEQVDDLLRETLYKKNTDVVPSRDSSFHVMKQRYVGIPRRKIMEFLRKQQPIKAVIAAAPKSKQRAGEKLKNYIFEGDLIFIKRNDLIKSNPRFERVSLEKAPELSYIISTCEKVTGLYRCNWARTKKPSECTPIFIKQMEEMAKQLKKPLNEFGWRADRGKEMNMDEIKKVLNPKLCKHVPMGPSVERRNRQLQQNFYRILNSRKAISIKGGLKQAQILMNQTFSSIHKKTPNEICEEKKEDNIKKYNKTRNVYIPGSRIREYKVGDYCRIMIKDAKPGIGYKTYKQQTYSKQVYIIKRKTKKAIPAKYYVKNKWYTQDKLIKSAPRDKKTNMLIKARDAEQATVDRTERVQHHEKRVEELEEGFDNPKARLAKFQGRKKKLETEEKIEKALDAEEDEKAGRKIVVKQKAKAKQSPVLKTDVVKSKRLQKVLMYMLKHNLRKDGTIQELIKRRRDHKVHILKMKHKKK